MNNASVDIIFRHHVVHIYTVSHIYIFIYLYLYFFEYLSQKAPSFTLFGAHIWWTLLTIFLV